MVSDVALFLVAICLMDITIGQGHTPSRPEPDESSTAQITRVYPASPNTQMYPTSDYMEKTNPTTFKYHLDTDYGSGNMLYAYQLGAKRDYGTMDMLLRDDLSTTFLYFEPFDYCNKAYSESEQQLTPEAVGTPLFPAVWTWLKDATYSGSNRIHNKDVDFWTYLYNDTASNTSTFSLLGVSSRNTNVPQFYFMYTLRGAGFSLKIYDNFKGGAPEETVFNIPSMCPGDHQISRLNDSLIPMRPNLAESFSAEITYLVRVSFNNDEEPLTRAKLYRNYQSKKLLQVNRLGLITDAGAYHRLLRLDVKKQYNYFSPFGICYAADTMKDTFQLDMLAQPMFKWVKKAKFSGVRQFRQRKVNTWTFTDNEASTFYSVGVSRINPNKPVFLYKMHTYYTYKRSVLVFEKYKPGSPNNRIFAVPKQCF